MIKRKDKTRHHTESLTYLFIRFSQYRLHSIRILLYILISNANEKEPIQSNSTSCPRHQMGKKHTRFRRRKIEQQEQKAKRTALSH